MDWDQIDWTALERLRNTFLNGSGGPQDYWTTERDLASYDLSFAQRIGWKWDYVLDELQLRNWAPPFGDILDWGCGSGVAGRAFLDRFPARALLLWDRSPLAMRFAARRAEERFPGLPVRTVDPKQTPFDTLLLSHVLTELDPAQLAALVELVRGAQTVLWVEPGTREVSRKLIEVREQLRSRFEVVAPCPHQGACGMLATRNAPHWCHQFAAPPAEVFTDARWARFAQLTGVDLRSLPLTFLVLDRRRTPDSGRGLARIIGRPRVYKAHALVFGCDQTGVQDRQLNKRDLPEPFRQLRKGRLDSLQVWECLEDQIVRMRSALRSLIGPENHS
jgi:SAM-dependent methyltransferase